MERFVFWYFNKFVFCYVKFFYTLTLVNTWENTKKNKTKLNIYTSHTHTMAVVALGLFFCYVKFFYTLTLVNTWENTKKNKTKLNIYTSHTHTMAVVTRGLFLL